MILNYCEKNQKTIIKTRIWPGIRISHFIKTTYILIDKQEAPAGAAEEQWDSKTIQRFC